MAANENSSNSQDIQNWMEDIAKAKTPRTKLVFDKATKKLVAVPIGDAKADNCLEFTAQEATRFTIMANSRLSIKR